MKRFSFDFYLATSLQFSPAYTAFRDHVVADGGTIASAPKAQQVLTYVAANQALGFVQWLDSRFGIRARSGDGNGLPKWYSVIGPQADAPGTIYGNAISGTDITLNVPVWVNSAFDGGSTPDLATTATYTIGMRYLLPAEGDGYLWGNRYGNDAGWSYLNPTLWRSYNNGTDAAITLALPRQVWSWVWMVKNGATVTIYDEGNNVLGQVILSAPIVALPLGIAGGTLSDGQLNGIRYQTFVRLASALTATQRAAIQAI